MPRVSRFKIARIADFYQQLRFAPAATRLRQMGAVEQLIHQIDPQRNYPEDFVIYRITGFRPERNDEPMMLVGTALMADLVNLVGCLSDTLELAWNENERRAILLAELAKQLNISTKTIGRCRSAGLICHFVMFPGDVKRLACYEDELERFITRFPDWLVNAGGFIRVPAHIQQKMFADATELRRTSGMSLHEAAGQLAERYGRAHETVRRILFQHDQVSDSRVFTEPGPVDGRKARIIDRAWRFGVSISTLSKHFSKSAPTIHRVINLQRVKRLQKLDLSFVKLPTLELNDAASVILEAAPVTTELHRFLPFQNALQFIADAIAIEEASEDTEAALIGGYNFLKRRARITLGLLGGSPAAKELDEVETDLRWATFLKRRLVDSALSAVIKVVEQHAHRKIDHLPASEIVDVLSRGFVVVGECVERLDPSRSQRLTRLSFHQMDRLLSQQDVSAHATRAAARHDGTVITLPNLYMTLNPWQPFLDLRWDMHAHLNRLEEIDRTLIEQRYGLSGSPPMTINQIASCHDWLDIITSRRVRKVEVALHRNARGQP